jgi:pyruvate formate lyase activating enzyme
MKDSHIELPVSNIERFAIKDGTGIRTVVFLQGCLLRCEWCSNPEAQTAGRKLMYSKEKCTGCGRCLAVCPKGANIINNNHVADIDRSKCINCGLCVDACLSGARSISGKVWTAEELYEYLIRDYQYYQQTKGGITFSGGEALIYAEQLVPLLIRLHDKGIGIAFETCGYVDQKNVSAVLPYVNQWLFDIKSLNEEVFKKYTGGELKVVIQNLALISKENPEKIVIRVPVIPGVNYTLNDMKMICDLMDQLSIERIDLLPYHVLGMQKYQRLGRKYPFEVTTPLNVADVQPLAEYFNNRNKVVTVGG